MTDTATSRLPARRADVDRTDHKARLEAAIEQQRIDILVEASRWREAGHYLDDGWHKLMQARTPLLIGGGLLLYRGIRHPASVARLARRLVAGALLVSRARPLLRLIRRVT
ncbi:YqjK family protein [Halomonas sp. LBP4]|uniref:YqjK family protein n=1 Tax=Halomonas sp. LBP4 TaxID=2044917 RepID=UPI000D7541C7|nr:YqjK family protein [Halomonas sp. LBP4]PXX97388.1 hypothetical protein CR157_11690 [Halomonas sp. LBP4]